MSLGTTLSCFYVLERRLNCLNSSMEFEAWQKLFTVPAAPCLLYGMSNKRDSHDDGVNAYRMVDNSAHLGSIPSGPARRLINGAKFLDHRNDN